MQNISHTHALKMIKTHGQTVFGVKFIKTDKSIRSMACKLHATNKAEEANQTGFHPSPNHDPYKVKVWDMNKPVEDGKGAFRTINVRRLFELSINGETFEVGE
jgi:hypothetical protein